MMDMLGSLKHTTISKVLTCCTLFGTATSVVLLSASSEAQPNTQRQDTLSVIPSIQVTVNSAKDGLPQADEVITLREAIALTNGTLTVSALSAEEKSLVVESSSNSTILFNLPADDTTIELGSVLPAIASPGLTIDGTTQEGYDVSQSVTAEIAIPTPVVAIRPKENVEVFRGLTISADDVTVRGLSLYGFNAPSQITRATPPADIFISHRPMPLRREIPLPAVGQDTEDREAPSGVVIEDNWLGLPPDEQMPKTPSGFGVFVFDSTGTTIQNNRIEYHNGSAIISSRQADNLAVLSNIIVGNGLAGMPDAIRLDGSIQNGLISDNLICGNDGSGVFLFKPDGAVTIRDNNLRFNGQRLRRAAIYLMGDDHRILDNSITNQKGGGVVVTAFGQGPNTQSTNNVVVGNKFHHIEGLSVDLNARRSRAVQDFQRGDGINPKRNSHNRRQDTANGAVNAPRFSSAEFFVIDNRVVISGEADPNNEVDLYLSSGASGEFGPLSKPVATAVADEDGRFEVALDEFVGGEVVSAIATDATYGTSEPAKNATVQSLDGSRAGVFSSPVSMPQCTTPPLPPEPPTPSEAPTTPDLPSIPTIQLEVPRNIHFALDKDFVSEESAIILDKIAAVLTEYPSIVVDLHGHTDSRASVSYNQDLARRRAENARQYLLSKGIGPERMTIRSFGETALLVDETNRTNFARNRRVEFVFQDVRGVDITFVNQEEDLQIEP